jgi:hypothetical protein
MAATKNDPTVAELKYLAEIFMASIHLHIPCI